jgi:4-hydroxybenzoate polyprenyltransferase
MAKSQKSHIITSNKLLIFLEMIKFEHSIFALPFAYLGLFLGFAEKATVTSTTFVGARHASPLLSSFSWPIFLWVTVAMVSLRTAAMALNRLIDQAIDAQNPRTQARALPAGLLSRPFTWFVTALCLAIFVFSAARLNPMCLMLSPIPIALSVIYPYLKRFTWLSHWVLGLTLGIAPYGGWLAVQPEWSWIPGILTIAVTCWVSGFDVFYALQDVAFDRTRGLHSLPSRFGVAPAVLTAKLSQGITIAAFVVLGLAARFGLFYWIGVIAASGLIWREHRMVSAADLSKLNVAFFNMNAWVSVVIFAGTFLDLMVN